MRPRRGPNPGQLFEITTRSIDRRLLLRPSKEVNDIIVGVIGRAQQHYDIQIHAFVFMSTHYDVNHCESVELEQRTGCATAFTVELTDFSGNSKDNYLGTTWKKCF